MKNGKINNQKYLGIITVLVFCLTYVLASTVFYAISEPEGTTENRSFIAEYNFTEANLKSVKWAFNGTNITIFDDSVVLKYNFDNRSSLGENDSYVFDISGNGNNGTVQNGLEWFSGSGRFGTGSFNFTGRNESVWQVRNIIIDNNPSIVNTSSNWSISGCIIPYDNNNNDRKHIINVGGTYSEWISWYDGAERISMNVRNGTDNSIQSSNNKFPEGELHCFTYTSEKIGNIHVYNIYVDGIFDRQENVTGTLATGTNDIMIGAHKDYPSLDYLSFNGTIDDITIWNRTLFNEEVVTINHPQLTKYNSENWTFKINQTFQTNIYETYDYYLCSTDSSDNENCTDSKTITRIQESETITGNFSNSVEDIRSDFYGMNIQNPKRIVGKYNLDTNCDGTGETPIDTDWSKEIILDSGMNYNRYDISLGSYYTGLYNLDFETWKNTSSVFVDSSSLSTGISKSHGWGASAISGGTGFFTRTTDSKSGDYAINISNNGTSGTIFLYRAFGGNPNWTSGTYNFSAWVKGSGNIVIKWGNATGSYSTFCSQSIVLSGTYQYVSCSANFDGYDGVTTFNPYLSIEGVGVGEEVLVDDVEVLRDGEEFRWWRTGNDTIFKDAIQWNYDNNQRMLLILDYMPTFLANWSDPNCEGFSGDSSGDGTCMPYDFNIWRNITVDMISRFTNDNSTIQEIIDIEMWNEPYGNLGNYTYDSVPLALAYVQLANNSYNAIKGYNSNINFFIPSGFQMTTTPNIFLTTISNMSNRFDGITAHPYASNYKGTNNMYNYLKNITDTCINLGGGDGCYRIIASEWETYNTKNVSNGQSDDFKSELAMAYQSVLNWNPNNASMQFYHYLDSVSYFNCPSRYSEYPSFWSAVSPAGLDNPEPTYYPPYNVTKNFAHLCTAGSTVYTSSSTDSTLKTVTCKDNNKYNTIIINTDTEAKNISLDLGNLQSNLILTNYENSSESYDTTDPSNVELGVIDSYEILYLTGEYENEQSSGGGGSMDYPEIFGGVPSSIQDENIIEQIISNDSETNITCKVSGASCNYFAGDCCGTLKCGFWSGVCEEQDVSSEEEVEKIIKTKSMLRSLRDDIMSFFRWLINLFKWN